MEEKDRYEIVYFDNDTRWKIIDNKTKQEVGGINDMIKLLNQQDRANYELSSECTSVNWTNECLQEQVDLLKKCLRKFENIEKEIGCDIEVFWKVYRKISGHKSSDIELYAIINNEIEKILPTEIISGTYSNYPQDCSFMYHIWDKEKKHFRHTYSYFHFHDYNKEWFLSEKEAVAKLKEFQTK